MAQPGSAVGSYPTGHRFKSDSRNHHSMKTRLSLVLFAVIALPLGVFAQAGENLPTFDGRILKTATAPVNGTNEIDTITIGGTPTAGSFTLTYDNRTTAAITWSATNATLVANIDAALEALPNIGTSGVTTAVDTMTAGIGTITVTFAGSNVAKKNVPVMTGTSSLTGSSPTLAVATTTAGVEADGRLAAKGTLLIDAGTPDLYINDGSPPNPTWTKVSP